MKWIFLSLGIIFFYSNLLQASNYKNIFNPLSGKFDAVNNLSSSTLPSGSTNYIQNNPIGVQVATFSVQSGTITGSAYFASQSGNVAIGVSTASEKLHVQGNNYTSGEFIEGTGSPSQTGTFGLTVINKTSNFTADGNSTVYLVDASAGNVVATIPLASGKINRIYIIHKTDSSINSITLAPTGSDLIRGASSLIITAPHNWVQIISDGSGWH